MHNRMYDSYILRLELLYIKYVKKAKIPGIKIALNCALDIYFLSPLYLLCNSVTYLSPDIIKYYYSLWKHISKYSVQHIQSYESCKCKICVCSSKGVISNSSERRRRCVKLETERPKTASSIFQQVCQIQILSVTAASTRVENRTDKITRTRWHLTFL